MIAKTKTYENQAAIVEENRKLKEINPDLSIGRTGVSGNKVISIGVSIPLKGNSTKIRQLEEDGWKSVFRKKRANQIIQYMDKMI